LFACDFENDDPVIVIDGCHVRLFRSVVAISERILLGTAGFGNFRFPPKTD
jgi:hypothetical protein